MSKNEKFIIAGRRLLWFEAMHDEDLKNIHEDVTSIHADFNVYYLNFVICTKYDIRIYDAVKGRLKKVYSDVLD